MAPYTILSFDIGINNLAFQILQSDDFGKDAPSTAKIIDWGVLCIKPPNDGCKINTVFNLIANELVIQLHDKFGNFDGDYVLIENQPCMKNPVMKSIQMMIYSFFTIKAYQEGSDMKVRLVAANKKLQLHHKLEPCTATKTSKSNQYKMRKLASIQHAKHYLQLSHAVNTTWIDVFNSSKKQDDLADTYCFNLNFLESGPYP
jgi:hypothetical protein